MCSETSPRLSFSNDLGQEDDQLSIHPECRRDATLLDSCSDFEFSICSSSHHEPSMADELFADGMILPLQIQERNANSYKQMHRYAAAAPRKASLPPLPCPPVTSAHQNPKKESAKETMIANSEIVEEKPQSKSFWGFKRSASLNCDIRRSLICSLPLLSRSNSTGSVPNPKRTALKDMRKQSPQKQRSNSMAKSSSSSSSSSSFSSYIYSIPQKPPVKRNFGGIHGNGVRIGPVLNVPPPYISKGTASLLGLGSFFRNGKERKTRK